MKNRRNEWMDEFAYKIALSAPCVCMGTLVALVWAVILLVSIAILLYEIWRGDFEDDY